VQEYAVSSDLTQMHLVAPCIIDKSVLVASKSAQVSVAPESRIRYDTTITTGDSELAHDFQLTRVAWASLRSFVDVFAFPATGLHRDWRKVFDIRGLESWPSPSSSLASSGASSF